MRLRARWGIAPLLAAPAGAWALGLGQIEVVSSLNQPFRAEIELSATADELQGLKVALASPEVFARQSIDRPSYLTSMEFRIVTARNGRSVVQVTSRDSIPDPFVDLLVEVTSSAGRQVRQYTVFLNPPVLLPGSATPPAIQPAETRPSSSTAPITRPAAPSAPTPAAPEPSQPPAQQVTPAIREPSPDVSSTPPSTPPPLTSQATPPASTRQPVAAADGVYGPVQRGDTLWGLSNRLRPEGISINQMMIAIYRQNQDAFGGNINLLRAGASLRLPESIDFDGLATTVANAEVRRQTDEWQDRAAQGGQLRLIPTDTQTARTPAPTPTVVPPPVATPPPRAADTPAPSADAAGAVSAAGGADERPIAVRNDQLQSLQAAADAANPENAAAPDAAVADPGVQVESEPVFTDEQPAPEQAAPQVPSPPARPVSTEPSLVSKVLGWVLSPWLVITLGVAALLLTAAWFVRRRRHETADVTGTWEALEQETDEDQDAFDAAEETSRPAHEETIVVEEQHADRLRPQPVEPEQAPARRGSAPRAQKAISPDETLSSQTVINLDQADAVAEADFHIAYGLYDQAAELVQKALEVAPDRRDLKLKLLEVYFMWGNKDAFLKAAQSLRSDLGSGDDPDWNKVVIMGKQICPDERLFTEAKAGAGRIDVDLEAGDSPLDLAFDDAAAAAVASSGVDLDLESSGNRAAPRAAKPAAKPAARGKLTGDSLDIGDKTAAGLEAALFADDDQAETGRRARGNFADTLAETQESPTVERPGSGSGRWALEATTGFSSQDSPTMETPTIESPAAKGSSATMKTRTLSVPRRSDAPTVETPALTSTMGSTSGEFTAEIDLDDLGLDVKDIEGLPTDLGDLPLAGASDTREQPALRGGDGLLSATGVTKVLHDDDDATGSSTSLLEVDEATLLAGEIGEMTGTEVLEERVDDESGRTSLVKSLRGTDGAVDLDLADLTAALHGADTVEQPRSFARDVFGGGSTPLDLDVGDELAGGDDDPTGTEEAGLDPQTMTEVGTKLDLARAYIDMGDPEGARSILQEVLDEGDGNQRREAQGLIDALPA